MKKTFSKIISVLLLVTMLFSMGIVSSAASESSYVATFSIDLDKSSVAKGEDVTVSVNLKTNYYIYSMELPVIYDGDAFEIQNTSVTSLKSFLSFKGKMADAYRTNGNWKSPADFYTNRNSNTEYWSQKEVMDRYKIAFASWSADSTLNDGKAIRLSNEETIVTFVLKAKKDIKDTDGLVFLSLDFQKTSEFAGGRLFCGRSKTEKIDVNNFVAVGQTIKYDGAAPKQEEVKADSTIVVNYKATASLKDELNSTILKDYKLKWSSSDESVVTVDEDGNIYGVKAGSATVTATSTDGKFTKTFDVEVNYSVLQWIIIIVLFGWIWYI